jgi:hypothetical protein
MSVAEIIAAAELLPVSERVELIAALQHRYCEWCGQRDGYCECNAEEGAR